jgi:hypothetical protein
MFERHFEPGCPVPDVKHLVSVPAQGCGQTGTCAVVVFNDQDLLHSSKLDATQVGTWQQLQFGEIRADLKGNVGRGPPATARTLPSPVFH